MTDSHKAGKSRKTLIRRTLLSSALALGIGGPALMFSGSVRAAEPPEPTTHRHAWQEGRERLGEDLIRDALRLTPEQQQAWQAIRAKREAQRKERFRAWSEVRQALQAELAKPEPDLARVAALRDRARERNLQARKEIENMRLKLYASFSPEQKAVVRDFLKVRLARSGHWRKHEREWRGAHPAKPGAPREAS